VHYNAISAVIPGPEEGDGCDLMPVRQWFAFPQCLCNQPLRSSYTSCSGLSAQTYLSLFNLPATGTVLQLHTAAVVRAVVLRGSWCDFCWSQKWLLSPSKTAIWGTYCFIDGVVAEISISFGLSNGFCVGDWHFMLSLLHKTSLSQALRCGWDGVAVSNIGMNWCRTWERHQPKPTLLVLHLQLCCSVSSAHPSLESGWPSSMDSQLSPFLG